MRVPVRAVLCDLDDTLFDHRRATRDALASLKRDSTVFDAWTIDELDRRHADLLEILHRDVLAGRRTIENARIERFGQLMRAASATADISRAAEVARSYRRAYEVAWHPVTGAREFAAAVKRAGLAFVIVTNSMVEEQRLKLLRCGLAPCVDALVTSEEIGWSKPDARIFEAALQRAGAEAADAVMVGDAWGTDIEGARACGLRAVWFNPLGLRSPDPSVRELASLFPTDDVIRLIVGGRDAPALQGAEWDRV